MSNEKLRESWIGIFDNIANSDLVTSIELGRGQCKEMAKLLAINTPKHETVEELRITVEKTKDCAKVSLKYGDKLLTSEDINSHNVLISDMFLSHIRGTVCNLIVDVVKSKPEVEE